MNKPFKATATLSRINNIAEEAIVGMHAPRTDEEHNGQEQLLKVSLTYSEALRLKNVRWLPVGILR